MVVYALIWGIDVVKEIVNLVWAPKRGTFHLQTPIALLDNFLTAIGWISQIKSSSRKGDVEKEESYPKNVNGAKIGRLVIMVSFR